MTDGKDNERIDALRKKLEAAKTALAAENVKKQQREARNRKRLAEIIGAALIEAELSSDLKSSIKQILAAAVLDDGPQRFLRERGWL